MKEDEKIKKFKNDADFINFAINKQPIFEQTKSGVDTFDFGFSEIYEKCVKEGILFDIEDPHSRIKKNKQFSYRTITKNVDNLITEYKCQHKK